MSVPSSVAELRTQYRASESLHYPNSDESFNNVNFDCVTLLCALCQASNLMTYAHP
jgi:hypothetical protein